MIVRAVISRATFMSSKELHEYITDCGLKKSSISVLCLLESPLVLPGLVSVTGFPERTHVYVNRLLRLSGFSDTHLQY